VHADVESEDSGIAYAAPQRGETTPREERSVIVAQQSDQTIVPNEVYNVITALANKLEGLAAYNKYEQDGGSSAQMWPHLRQQDEQAARQLLAQLQQLAQQGQLQASAAGAPVSAPRGAAENPGALHGPD